MKKEKEMKVREPEDLKGPEYAYLGKFAKKKYLKEGHNFMKSEKGAGILGAVSSGIAGIVNAAAKMSLLDEEKTPETPKPKKFPKGIKMGDFPKPDEDVGYG